MTGCRFNSAGYLLEEPAAADVIGCYHLDLGQSQQRLRRMGYKNFTGEITLTSDGSVTATNLPACCVHGWDESSYPCSGGHYSLSGTWKTTKSSAVYVVRLKLSAAHMNEPPATTNATVLKDRNAPAELEVHLIKGSPLSLGFPIFNGDFDDVVFSKLSK
jgi:hypothetical protein